MWSLAILSYNPDRNIVMARVATRLHVVYTTFDNSSVNTQFDFWFKLPTHQCLFAQYKLSFAWVKFSEPLNVLLWWHTIYIGGCDLQDPGDANQGTKNLWRRMEIRSSNFLWLMPAQKTWPHSKWNAWAAEWSVAELVASSLPDDWSGGEKLQLERNFLNCRFTNTWLRTWVLDLEEDVIAGGAAQVMAAADVQA